MAKKHLPGMTNCRYISEGSQKLSKKDDGKCYAVVLEVSNDVRGATPTVKKSPSSAPVEIIAAGDLTSNVRLIPDNDYSLTENHGEFYVKPSVNARLSDVDTNATIEIEGTDRDGNSLTETLEFTNSHRTILQITNSYFDTVRGVIPVGWSAGTVKITAPAISEHIYGVAEYIDEAAKRTRVSTKKIARMVKCKPTSLSDIGKGIVVADVANKNGAVTTAALGRGIVIGVENDKTSTVLVVDLSHNTYASNA